MDALFALKSARDVLGRSGENGLRIVATGSNRDKLAMLRSTEDQAFFGAPLMPFPLLDERYLGWFLDRNVLTGSHEVETVHRLFARAGHRPEILGAVADALRFELEPDGRPVAERFAAFVDERLAEADAVSLREVRSLTALQSARN